MFPGCSSTKRKKRKIEMESLFWFVEKTRCLMRCFCLRLAHLSRSVCYLTSCFYRFLLRTANPFWVQLCYLLCLSLFGFWGLKLLKPRASSFMPTDLDLLFMSVSATTVSSMSTVEMEVFSNSQLIIFIILMLGGGEVFTSMVGLFLRKSELKQLREPEEKLGSVLSNRSLYYPRANADKMELALKIRSDPENIESQQLFHNQYGGLSSEQHLRYTSFNLLGIVVLSYLLVINVFGTAFIWIYMFFASSARDVLKKKGLKLVTFCIFTTISSVSRCGFLPTNESMIVFRRNVGLLLGLIPQILLGSTLFPCCLRLIIWVLRIFVKREELDYLLNNTTDVEYKHLLPRRDSLWLLVTLLGFLAIQVVIFCSMEWNSKALIGLNGIEKFISAVFQCVNSRHAGETVVNLSLLSPATLVLFIFMMYLPPYTTFLPTNGDEKEEHSCKRRKRSDDFMFSQLSYVAIFMFLVCITERKGMAEDPLNFNMLNIAVEIISAYGNVGFTTGYSCDRRLKRKETCEDKWYGFVGKWSSEGKIIAIAIMLWGRLRKFNMRGGKAWKLL